MAKKKGKAAYMISAVAEMYGIHPQTLRLYEREGLLKPSRTEGNTRLYTDEDLLRLEFILSLARDLGVNIAGMAIILQMRERMEEMQSQIKEFVQYIQHEALTRANPAADQDILLVHKPEYVQKLRTGTLSPREEMEMEIPYSRELADAFWLAAGGSILAPRQALKDRACI